MLEKIKELFIGLNREPVAILSRDNSDWRYCDDDDPTYNWAVICKEALEADDYDVVIPFEKENEVDIIAFDEEGCYNGIDALVKELTDRDGAKLEWKK